MHFDSGVIDLPVAMETDSRRWNGDESRDLTTVKFRSVILDAFVDELYESSITLYLLFAVDHVEWSLKKSCDLNDDDIVMVMTTTTTMMMSIVSTVLTDSDDGDNGHKTTDTTPYRQRVLKRIELNRIE